MPAPSRACGICGHPVRPPFKAPQPEIAPDLDMRPGEPARSTLQDWVQVCRGCGAAAEDLAALPASLRPLVESEEYRLLSTTVLEETLPFRRSALILAHQNDHRLHAEALLQAAWAADDAAAASEAAALRRKVAALWDGGVDNEVALRRLDVLRRAGAFAEAEAWAAILAERPLDDLSRAIVAFQRTKIAARDLGRHLISSVLPPPAHKPHVTHTRRAEPGFWSRLLRRSNRR